MSFDRPTFGGYEDKEEGYGLEELSLPDSEVNWYEDLGDASGLDISPDSGVLNFGEIDSETTGSNGILHPAGEARLVAYAGSAVGSEVPVATTSGESLQTC